MIVHATITRRKIFCAIVIALPLLNEFPEIKNRIPLLNEAMVIRFL
jgi:hypothetical protein